MAVTPALTVEKATYVEKTTYTEEHARSDLAAVFRECGRLGWQIGIDQHFSLMLPGDPPRFLTNPYGFYFSELKASDLIVVDLEGNEIGGSAHGAAIGIHVPIHRARADAACVLHVHTPYLRTLSVLEKARLKPIHQDCLRLYERIAYDDLYVSLDDPLEEGQRMADILADNRALFLANHGVIVVGPTVAHAFDDLYFLEDAAQTQVMAMQCQHPMLEITRETALVIRDYEDKYRDKVATTHLEAIKRRLYRDEPEFAH
jgi:ribulose-5-phosphate 4-epimerase/fuculose-1-phosphate aldolase